MNGYMVKIPLVDLSSSQISVEPLDDAYARGFVGGSGLAVRYLVDLVDGELDPLSPEAPLIFMTGPVVGTALSSAGRYSVGALSPLTGIWGESNGGGFFGPELRFAGYDGLIITGSAAKPVWLAIVDGRPALHGASALWGLDAYETQEKVKATLQEPKARIACIGPAGEYQAHMAAIINDHGRAAARTGMGAVMGSKNLKAIAVRGHAKVPLADPAAFKTAIRAINAGMKEDMAVISMRLAGTASYVDMAGMFGDLPVRYYQQGEWDGIDKLSGVRMVEEYQNRIVACYRCSIACGRETRAPDYNLDKVDGPEYETLGSFGSLLMIDDMEAIIYAGHLCNMYGLDTISTGATIGLAMELFQRSILTADETGGIEIHYGDAATVHRLIEMMAYLRGFGAVLADGSAALAERFGVPELAVTVNKLEVPMHDPRAFSGLAVSYALSPRGACHMEGDMYSVDMGQGAAEELGIMPGDRLESSLAKGHIAARHQAWRNLYNALTLCQFLNPGVPLLLDTVNAITGWNWTTEDLLIVGKRLLTLKRLLNMKRGLTRANDRLPALLLKPLLEGGTEGTVPDVELLLAGAYEEYGWDLGTGVPTPATITDLGLNFAV